MQNLAKENAACFSDEVTCALRYVLQKACINQDTAPDFVALKEQIRKRIKGKDLNLGGYVARTFGFVEGTNLTVANIDVSHPSIAAVHSTPCLENPFNISNGFTFPPTVPPDFQISDMAFSELRI